MINSASSSATAPVGASLGPAPAVITPSYEVLYESIAEQIADLVRTRPRAVLGLATGASPVGVYAALSRRHHNEGLDFSQVTCFNLDEYFPMPPDSPRSYHAFMQANLFAHINCPRWFVPNGQAQLEEATADACLRYEQAIREAGGIDLQLLGIGRTGHIGFNEPGSSAHSRTRRVTLHAFTREDAAADFGGLAHVPAEAVTMGVGTILDARRIILMARGAGKAAIVREALEGGISEQNPASLLRRHPQTEWWLDAEAAHLLGKQ